MSDEQGAGPSKRVKLYDKPHPINLEKQDAVDIHSGPATPTTPATAISKLNIDTVESAPPFVTKPHFFSKQLLGKYGISLETGLMDAQILRGIEVGFPISKEVAAILKRQEKNESEYSSVGGPTSSMECVVSSADLVTPSSESLPVSTECIPSSSKSSLSASVKVPKGGTSSSANGSTSSSVDLALAQSKCRSAVGQLIFNVVNIKRKAKKYRSEFSAPPEASDLLSPDEPAPPLSPQETLEMLASIETHNRSRKVLMFDCFGVSTELLKSQDPEFMKKLGVCVKFVAKSCAPCNSLLKKCQNKVMLDKRCMRVCPHMVECDCLDKRYNTNWCYHIHLLHATGLNVFEDSVCLYVDSHVSYKMENHHFRALIIGKDGMYEDEECPGLYVERFQPKMAYSEKFMLKVNENAVCVCNEDPLKKCIKCGACACKYQCTCEDFWGYQQVCKHCHIVAMKLHENSEELFKDFEDFDVTGPENFTTARRESAARKQIESEHTLSLSITPKDIIKEDENNWLVQIRKFETNRVDRMLRVQRYSLQDRQCVCAKNFPMDLCCLDCRICKYHFICACKSFRTDGDPIICRHVHALQQSLTVLPDPDDEFGRLKMLYPDFKPEQHSFRKREPVTAL